MATRKITIRNPEDVSLLPATVADNVTFTDYKKSSDIADVNKQDTVEQAIGKLEAKADRAMLNGVYYSVLNQS